MNKKLIAVAIAAGLAAPMAAQAEATAYGQVQFEMANIDDGTNSGIAVTDQQRGRVGIKGSHDLGNGMKSYAKAEFDIEGSNTDAEFGNNGYGGSRAALRIREVNAGIKGSFGDVQIGTMKSAYKYTGGVKYDPFVTTTLEARGNGGMTGSIMGQNGFISNAIAYRNKFGMVDLWITYSPDGTFDNSNAIAPNDTGTSKGQYTAALKFGGDSWEAFVSAVDQGGEHNYDSTKVGGQWKSGAHKISGQYEMSSDAGTDVDTMFVGYQMKMGKNTLVAQIGQADSDVDADDTDYYALGVIHKFNKQTRIFAGYRSSEDSATPVNEESSLSVGLRVDI